MEFHCGYTSGHMSCVLWSIHVSTRGHHDTMVFLYIEQPIKSQPCLVALSTYIGLT